MGEGIYKITTSVYLYGCWIHWRAEWKWTERMMTSTRGWKDSRESLWVFNRRVNWENAGLRAQPRRVHSERERPNFIQMKTLKSIHSTQVAPCGFRLLLDTSAYDRSDSPARPIQTVVYPESVLLLGGNYYMGAARMGSPRGEISMIRFTSAARFFFFLFSTSSWLDKRIIHYHLLIFSFIPRLLNKSLYIYIYILRLKNVLIIKLPPLFTPRFVWVSERRDHIFKVMNTKGKSPRECAH